MSALRMRQGVVGLLLAGVLMSVAVESQARIRIHSSHGSGSHGHASSPDAPHASPDSGAGSIHVPRYRSNDASSPSSSSSATGEPPTAGQAGPEDETLRRVRAEKEAARAKAQAEQLEAQRQQQAVDAEKRRVASEQAAAAAEEEKKRQAAADKAKQREQAQQERLARQVAWERRCDIKPVMTDEEIAVCKEVFSRPGP